MRFRLQATKKILDTKFNSTSLQDSLGLRLAIRLSLIVFAVTLAFTYLIMQFQGLSAYDTFADPDALSKLSPLIGFFTKIGLFLWAAAAGICLFASSFSGRDGFENSSWRLFLNCSAVLSLLLLFDDAFMIHETYYYAFIDEENTARIIKNLFELVFFGLYAFLVSVYIARFSHFYKRTNYRILIGSLICFSLSVFVDLFLPISLIFIEDSFKFLGILMWLFYLADSGKRYIYRCLLNPAESSQPL